jgi:Tol biopolymer transport system component
LILFNRQGPDGEERSFTIKTDGSDEQTLCEPEGCGGARWSADWSQILAVGATGHGTWSLVTLNPDGSDQVVIDPPIETLSLFVGASSADGRLIAFYGMDDADPSRNGLYVAQPDLSNLKLVSPLAEGWLEVDPDGVTPDRSKIVFFVDTGPEGIVDHAGDVYVINTDGTGLRRLNPPDTRLLFLHVPVISLSPDGRQAAFAVLDDAVYVVDLDGGEARPITPRGASAWAVSWSPTSEWIVYTRQYGNASVTSLVRPDGTDQHEISANDASDDQKAPAWSPNGDYLLVWRGKADQRDLWIMDLEGRYLGQVTHEPTSYGTYSWAPSGD